MLEAYLIDWFSLSVKFLHIIAGIAWIGASFYFNWLENKLNRIGNREDIAGCLWAVHGGGFYYLEKYKKYPEKLPQPLHWFKWEAYFTWISGFLLLIIIYYFNASSFLLNSQTTLSPAYGITLSILGLVFMWVIYDLLCRTKIVEKSLLFVGIIALIIVFSGYFYGIYFTPRAMFMQIGAMIGTVMVANVLMIIIPVQRKLVEACESKTEISEELGRKGYIRSRHNNYFTLPVLFIMISNHYPFIYSNKYNYLILIAVFLIVFLIRHYFNLRGINKANNILILVIVCLVLALGFVLKPKTLLSNQVENIDFAKVKTIIQLRCVSCHSKTPIDDVFRIAPSGFILDTDKQIVSSKKLIFNRTIASDSMPFINKTKMTQEERDYLEKWINQNE